MFGRPAFRTLLLCAFLAALCWLVYQPVLEGGFLHFDDPTYVTANPEVTGGLRAEGVRWAFSTTRAGNWHPLTWLSHQADVELFDLNAGAHHRTNLLLHAANAVLLFLLFLRLTRQRIPSLLVAALFAVHPIHVESVAWVSERKDVLALFFGLGSLHLWVRWTRSESPLPYLGSLCLFACSLLCKASLVSLPFLLLLLDFWPLARYRTDEGRRQITRRVMEKAPLFALSLGASLVTLFVQRAGGAVATAVQIPVWERIQNALVSYVLYLRHLAWPNELYLGYPHPALTGSGWTMLQVVIAFALLALISSMIWHQRRRAPELLFGWLWFLGALVPMIGLVQVGGQALADRYAYVSAIGVYVAISFGLAGRLGARAVPVLAGLTLLACAALFPRTSAQVRVWQSTQSLAVHTLGLEPNAWSVEFAYGNALRESGRHSEAKERFLHVTEVVPGLKRAHFNLANTLHDLGEMDPAFASYRRALELDPDYGACHLNFGASLRDDGALNEAEGHLKRAVELLPDSAPAHFNMGHLQLRLIDPDGANRYFEKAMELDPAYPGAKEGLEAARKLRELLMSVGDD